MADGKVVISTALDNSGIEKDAGKLKSSVSNAAKSVSGTLGGLTKVVAGVTATITAAFGAAAVAITKQAVDAYADYEQLIGGVETLFGDAADKVVGYAEDAFYTVGISANEYMETVTSFSASLINSLAGDTAKAAIVADMALTDMADNANKMGTPLESIKSAYQGFAKQNYTMLDNLKLGYGGTKTEMERLLKDAQKLTGVKYNINNLSDVYNAIHAIQVEMGIAGTTAKEAEKTITGSANMTKAAWKNVLAAIAGGGDLDRAINNLVYSVSKYFENIVPVVERALSGIGELIEKVAPQLVEAVAAALIKAIPHLLNAVYQMILGLANGIYEGIVALFSGSTKEIEAQLNTTDKLADGYNAAADGASDLADATEEAGKAAQKYLAPFDEITKLGGKDSNVPTSPSFGPTSSGAATGGTGVTLGGSGVELSPALQAAMQAIAREFEELVKPLREIDFSLALNSVQRLGKAFQGLGTTITKALKWSWFNILVPLGKWTIEDGGPAAVDALSSAFEALDLALDPVLEGFEELWEDLQPLFEFLGDTAVAALEELEMAFDNLAVKIEEKSAEIERIFSGIGVMFSTLWSRIEPILAVIRETFISVFQSATTVAVDRFGFLVDALSGVIDFVAGVLTGDWERAWEGLANAVKSPVNLIISIINSMISAVVTGVNTVIGMVNTLSFEVPDWVPGLGGKTFGFDLNRIEAPQIPYLAKGAVLPPNQPFLAVVGDQKHGTNVEAPLETIQEAVAIVMEDMIQSNIAGHEATVAVLREILEAVLGIHIGDDVIGQAVARYNAKMAVIRGGA